ncbi:MAG: hypothetical protein K2P65_04910 [Lachnospiraceae bacterium]|nr:hypothetical protein [Lachnospiraceae bacterium]
MIIDYQVHFINFPNTSAREAVTENPDGSYTIFIEASLSRDRQQEAFSHALRHILNNDFSLNDINMIESDAHNLVFQNKLQNKVELKNKYA